MSIGMDVRLTAIFSLMTSNLPTLLNGSVYQFISFICPRFGAILTSHYVSMMLTQDKQEDCIEQCRLVQNGLRLTFGNPILEWSNMTSLKKLIKKVWSKIGRAHYKLPTHPYANQHSVQNSPLNSSVHCQQWNMACGGLQKCLLAVSNLTSWTPPQTEDEQEAKGSVIRLPRTWCYLMWKI